MNQKQKIAIIGYGRFGQLLASITKDDFEVVAVEQDPALQEQAVAQGFSVIPFESVSEATYIYLAVPISAMGTVVTQLAPLMRENHVVLDVCSVKVHPANLMKQHLAHCQTIATHPLFGPDSASNGLTGLKVFISPIHVDDVHVAVWRDFWTAKGATVIESTPEEHDQDTAYSQAFTYTIAKMILEMHIPDLTFTTRSYERLKEIADLSANDSEQLFHDMLAYNPYCKDMTKKLEQVAKSVLAELE